MFSMKTLIVSAFAAALSISSAAKAQDMTLSDPVFKTLYEEARKAGEDEVVYYCAARTEEAEALTELWAANFPDLPLKIVPKKAPELIALVQAEAAAGRIMGDVVTSTQPYIAPVWKKEGRFEPYKTAAFSELGSYADPDGAFYSTGLYLLSPIYNTNILPNPEDRPKTLADLLDPKWKGKMVMADPATAGNARTFFLGMYLSGKMDWAYLEKLAQQDVLFVRTSPESVRMVASGERPLTPSVSSHNVITAMAVGQAINLYGMDDGTIVTEGPTGILKGSPHPIGAKLLLEVLTSAQGQALLSGRANYWPTNSKAQTGAGLPPLESFNPITVDLSAISDAEVDEFMKRFGKTFGRE